MKAAGTLALLMLASMVLTPSAEACTCIFAKDVRAEYRRASAVFVGRVMDSTAVPAGTVVRFRVLTAWKGVDSRETTAFSSAGCPPWFMEGEVGYLVLVYGAGENRNVECTRTRLLEYAAHDLVTLGKPKRTFEEDPSFVAQEMVAAMEVEKKRARAAIARDVKALERVLGDALVYTHSTGWTETKAEHIESIRSGALRYEKIEHGELRVRVYGQTAILTGPAHMRVFSARRNETIVMNVRFTAVYVKSAAAGWQLTAWQTTRIPE